MTSVDLVRRVIGRLIHEGFDSSGIFEPDIFSQVRPALIDLGIDVSNGPSIDAIIFRKTYTITLGAGNKVSLNTQLIAASQPMIIKLPFPAVNYTGSTVELESELAYVEDPQVANLIDGASDVAYYSMEDQIFQVFHEEDLSGDTCTITTNFIPSMSDITRPYESKLEDMVVAKWANANPTAKKNKEAKS